MKKITKRIFSIVLIFCAICFVAVLVLVFGINQVTKKNELVMDKYIRNRQYMNDINQKMYEIQSLISGYIITTDEGQYDEYEKEVSEAKNAIDELLVDFNENLDDEEDEELLHQVSRNYRGFLNQIEVVYSLCRDGNKYVAETYVCDVMSDYLDNVNKVLKEMEDRTQNDMVEAEKEVRVLHKRIRAGEIVCIISLVVSICICIALIDRSGKMILFWQDRSIKEHNQHIMNIQNHIIFGMANLIESRDGNTGEHVKRTSHYVDIIVRQLEKMGYYKDEIDSSYIENISKAAPLHDIGKIRIPDAILQKKGKLTDEEFEEMKTHTTEGSKIVRDTIGDIGAPEYIQIVNDVVKFHHEKWNGTGYPCGLSGEDIPLAARIMAVADVFDALVSKRCYKDEFSVDKAYEIINEDSGKHFDPKVAKAFEAIRDDVEKYLISEKHG